MSIDSIKTQAELWRLLLHWRFADLFSVQRWADSIIAKQDISPAWVIDVSLSGADRAAAIEALASAPGRADERLVWAGVMRNVLQWLEDQPHRDTDVARFLYSLAFEAPQIAPHLGAPPGGDQLGIFWDDIELAREGLYGNRLEIREEMRSFLRRLTG